MNEDLLGKTLVEMGTHLITLGMVLQSRDQKRTELVREAMDKIFPKDNAHDPEEPKDEDSCESCSEFETCKERLESTKDQDEIRIDWVQDKLPGVEAA